ncbi:Predicted arabinose efflux permease, MFS family [Alteribacillus bidgolensis]|uniref:Predicted arabinose efflux permease, MFS family n=1 Tax=Alteribacillus bidgolensis TaxID=930129 RepID=A0A1G8Q2H8_9BACI|nr:Predicted arabinose efflux permease, MFS family [Alteribacillus bidgolensis]
MLLTVLSPIIGMLSSYGAIVVLRGIQGFVAASFAPTALTFLTELYPPKKRAASIGFISAAFLMAGIIGQVYSSVVNEAFGWNYVFYLFGFIYLGLGAAFIAAIPNDSKCTSSVRRSVFKTFTTVLTKPFFICNYFITILLLLSFVGMYTALESKRISWNSNKLLVRSAGIIGMLFAPFGSRLARKFGAFVMIRIGLSFAGIGLFFIGLTINMTMMIVMSIVFTAGISVTVPSVISLISIYGGKERATAMSLYSFFLFVGSTIGPMFAIYLMKTVTYGWIFIILSIFLGVGFFVTFFISKKGHS